MTSSAAHDSHVSTWLSFGNVTLTLARSAHERRTFSDRLKAPDAHPDVHFAQASLASAIAEFGMELAGRGRPETLKTPQPFLSDEARKLLQCIHEIPAEEKAWCFAVLRAAYGTIRYQVRKTLNTDKQALTGSSLPPFKVLPTGATKLLPIDRRLSPCGEPDEPGVGDEASSDKRLAFNIVVHIHPHSRLAHFFAMPGYSDRGSEVGEYEAGASSSFQPPKWEIGPHPSTWGFEMYCTQTWKHTLQQWSGCIEEKMLKRSVIEVRLCEP